MARLARSARTRTTAFSPQEPTDWRPTQVRRSEGGFSPYFTHAAAWELIADKLDEGHEVEVVELRKPPGAKGYVMKIDLGPDVPTLYVKLQLRGGAGRRTQLSLLGTELTMEPRHVDATPTTCRPCAECGSSVATSWHSHTFKYGSGASAADLTVRVPIRRCDDCDFDYLDDEAERIMHEAVCHHLGVLTPSEVRGIREYHGLSRAAFAKITGIGEASLGRWENGIKVQTPANDRYLRLLAQPSILGLLQEAEGVASVPAGLAGRARFRRIEVSATLRKRQRSFSLRPRQAPVGLAA